MIERKTITVTLKILKVFVFACLLITALVLYNINVLWLANDLLLVSVLFAVGSKIDNMDRRNKSKKIIEQVVKNEM